MERSRANKKTGFKIKSPFPQTKFTYARSRSGDPAEEEVETTLPPVRVPANTGEDRSVEDFKSDADVTEGTEITEKEPEKWYEKRAWKDSGIGHIADAFNVIRKGVKDRKAKKRDTAADESEKLRGRDAVADIDKKGKKDYGYHPWEEGYTPEKEVQYDEDGKPIKRS